MRLVEPGQRSMPLKPYPFVPISLKKRKETVMSADNTSTIPNFNDMFAEFAPQLNSVGRNDHMRIARLVVAHFKPHLGTTVHYDEGQVTLTWEFIGRFLKDLSYDVFPNDMLDFMTVSTQGSGNNITYELAFDSPKIAEGFADQLRLSIPEASNLTVRIPNKLILPTSIFLNLFEKLIDSNAELLSYFKTTRQVLSPTSVTHFLNDLSQRKAAKLSERERQMVDARRIWSDVVSLTDTDNSQRDMVEQAITRLQNEILPEDQRTRENAFMLYEKCLRVLTEQTVITVAFNESFLRSEDLTSNQLQNVYERSTRGRSGHYTASREQTERKIFEFLSPKIKQDFYANHQAKPRYGALMLISKNNSVGPISNYYGQSVIILKPIMKYNAVLYPTDSLNVSGRYRACTIHHLEVLLQQCPLDTLQAIAAVAQGQEPHNFSQSSRYMEALIPAVDFFDPTMVESIHIHTHAPIIPTHIVDHFKARGITIMQQQSNPYPVIVQAFKEGVRNNKLQEVESLAKQHATVIRASVDKTPLIECTLRDGQLAMVRFLMRFYGAEFWSCFNSQFRINPRCIDFILPQMPHAMFRDHLVTTMHQKEYDNVLAAINARRKEHPEESLESLRYDIKTILLEQLKHHRATSNLSENFLKWGAPWSGAELLLWLHWGLQHHKRSFVDKINKTIEKALRTLEPTKMQAFANAFYYVHLGSQKNPIITVHWLAFSEKLMLAGTSMQAQILSNMPDKTNIENWPTYLYCYDYDTFLALNRSTNIHVRDSIQHWQSDQRDYFEQTLLGDIIAKIEHELPTLERQEDACTTMRTLLHTLKASRVTFLSSQQDVSESKLALLKASQTALAAAHRAVPSSAVPPHWMTLVSDSLNYINDCITQQTTELTPRFIDKKIELFLVLNQFQTLLSNQVPDLQRVSKVEALLQKANGCFNRPLERAHLNATIQHQVLTLLENNAVSEEVMAHVYQYTAPWPMTHHISLLQWAIKHQQFSLIEAMKTALHQQFKSMQDEQQLGDWIYALHQAREADREDTHILELWTTFSKELSRLSTEKQQDALQQFSQKEPTLRLHAEYGDWLSCMYCEDKPAFEQLLVQDATLHPWKNQQRDLLSKLNFDTILVNIINKSNNVKNPLSATPLRSLHRELRQHQQHFLQSEHPLNDAKQALWRSCEQSLNQCSDQLEHQNKWAWRFIDAIRNFFASALTLGYANYYSYKHHQRYVLFQKATDSQTMLDIVKQHLEEELNIDSYEGSDASSGQARRSFNRD